MRATKKKTSKKTPNRKKAKKSQSNRNGHQLDPKVDNHFGFVFKKKTQLLKDPESELVRHGLGLTSTGADLQDIIHWIEHNIWLEGSPFSFERAGPKIEYGEYDIVTDVLHRPYLPQILTDASPIRSIIKCRQSELTTLHINEHLYYLCNRSYTRIAHIFPTDGLSQDVSNEKVRPVIEDSPNIKKLAKGTGAVHNYRFDNGSAYSILGSLNRAGGRAGSRDIISFDEFQFMPESVIGVFEKLLSHSALRLVRKVSTPETPLVGIDKAVKDGCEYVWLWKCGQCKREQAFTWPDSVINYFDPSYLDYDDPAYQKKLNKVFWGCKFCGSYVDRNSPFYLANSKWVPKRPNLVGINSSYYITIPMIPWKTGKELLHSYHRLREYPHTFMNEDWGESFIRGEARLDMSDLIKCQREWPMVYERTKAMSNVVMGIDHGERSSWVVVACRGFDPVDPRLYCVVYIEEINQRTLQKHGFNKFSGLEHTRRCKQLIAIFQPSCVLTDSNGIGSDRGVSISRSFPRITWNAFYDTQDRQRTAHQSKLLVPNFSKEKGKPIVTLSKLHTLKELISEVRRKQWAFPATRGDDAEVVKEYLHHLTSLGIQPRFDQQLDREYEAVVKLHPADHLADCTIYAKSAFHKLTGFKTRKPGVIAGS